MIKGINREEHGIADYIYVPLVLAAPKLLGFEKEQPAAGFCYTMAATALGYTLFTDAPWGIVKGISYKTHAAIDLLSGVVSITALLVLPVRKQTARTTLFLMGITGLVIGTLSLIGAARSVR